MKHNTMKATLRKPSRCITRIIADNIIAFRIQMKISQEEFADMCNFHRTYIGSIERGERNVTISTLEVLAEALDINVPTLLNKASIKNAIQEKTRSAVR